VIRGSSRMKARRTGQQAAGFTAGCDRISPGLKHAEERLYLDTTEGGYVEVDMVGGGEQRQTLHLAEALFRLQLATHFQDQAYSKFEPHAKRS
jgi:hypothetical protein